VLQASLAETQRRAQKDQMDSQLDQQKLQAEMVNQNLDRQLKVALNTENNLTKERVKAADMTIDEARLQKEQQETAIKLNDMIQRDLLGG
jgi:predicted secreted acid phosphatase